MKGLDATKKGFDDFFKQVSKDKTRQAITAIATQGLAFSDMKTPIMDGHLINSRYGPIVEETSEGVSGRVGYTANYAAKVHEAKGSTKGKNILRNPAKPEKGVFWSPDGEPKFLEKGFEEVEKNIPQILKKLYE